MVSLADFTSFVHLENDLVGIPVGEEVHASRNQEGDYHSGLAPDKITHGNQQQGQRCQEKNGFDVVHFFYLRESFVQQIKEKTFTRSTCYMLRIKVLLILTYRRNHVPGWC